MPIKLININFINALAITVVIGSFIFFFYCIIRQPKEVAYLSQIITAIISMNTLILGFYYGSSKSSMNKDATIKSMQETIDTNKTN